MDNDKWERRWNKNVQGINLRNKPNLTQRQDSLDSVIGIRHIVDDELWKSGTDLNNSI